MSVCHLLFFALCSVGAAARLQLDVQVDHLTGHFVVNVNQRRWFGSGEVFLRANNELYSSRDSSLSLTGVSASPGRDGVGSFDMTEMTWQTRSGVTMKTNIKEYENCVIFGQSFPDEVVGTSSGDADKLITAFPSFTVSDEDQPEGYCHWISWYWFNQSNVPNAQASRSRRELLEAKGFQSPVYGRWRESTVMYGGIGGSGVTAIFNEDASIAAILSPFDNFMASSQLSPSRGVRMMGIMGNVTSIPKGYATSSILYFGDGIQAAMAGWGATLLRNYGKADLDSSGHVQADISLSYLGYTTDNGAYYYYNTVPGLNYQDTMVAVKEYSDSLKLPYRYYLLDSWWYYKSESTGGVTNWEPKPDVYPDGVEYVYNKTGWLVQGHNRYWSDETVYAKENGGAYNFLLDHDTGGALPLDQVFWDEFLGQPKSAWGLRVYEQDWLWNEYYQYVPTFLTSVSMGRTWLSQMANGAEKNGLTIQYCMPHIRHVLQSVEFPVVTQARASDDYKPGEDTEQWRIGGQSLLFASLGLAPSKDGFWSTTSQPGNPYGDDHTEPTPRLQAAVLTLSRGPIAVADGIGYSDAALIMRSCRQDGKLLQPSRPASAIDAMILQAALGGRHGPEGEVWLATTEISGLRYGYLLAADMKREWVVKPSHLGYAENSEFWVFESNNTETVTYFSEDSPLTLKACGIYDFSLFTLVPIVRSSSADRDLYWGLLGEPNKWVSVSTGRFVGLSMSPSGANVVASGSIGESLVVRFVDPSGRVTTVTCQFDARESLVVSSSSGCV